MSATCDNPCKSISSYIIFYLVYVTPSYWMIFRPSSSNKELSFVLFFAEETRLRHRVRRTIILVSYLTESRCPPRVSCDSESRETSGTDGERAVLILICTSPILATTAAQRSDSDNIQKRGKTFHLIYFRMNIQQKIAVWGYHAEKD